MNLSKNQENINQTINNYAKLISMIESLTNRALSLTEELKSQEPNIENIIKINAWNDFISGQIDTTEDIELVINLL